MSTGEETAGDGLATGINNILIGREAVEEHVQVTCFSDVSDDLTLHFQIIRLPNQIYAWIGCNSAKFGHLYAAAPTRPNNTVSVASLLAGASDNTGSGIARRIVMKTGLNVILACNIPKDNPMLEVCIEIPYLFVQALVYSTVTYSAMGFYWSISKVVWYFYVTFFTLLYFSYQGMLIVSLSPDMKVASILAVAIYTILSLFSGFLIPGPAIPKWWIWLYYITPTSWFLNGIITPQYGDIKQEISAFGESKALNSFLEDYFGFYHNRSSILVVIIAIFPMCCALSFAYFIGKLKFQMR